MKTASTLYTLAVLIFLIPIALLFGGGLQNREDLMWFGTFAFLPCGPIALVFVIAATIARVKANAKSEGNP